MWRTLAALVLLGAALAFASRVPFPAVRSAERERAALERLLADYVRANADEDPEALAALYADDALLLPPEEGVVEGADSIRAFWAGNMEPGLVITPVRVEVHGDAGVLVGRYTVPEHAGAPADSGKCVLTMRRSGLNWRIVTDIWNSSTPTGDEEAPGVEERDSVVTPVELRSRPRACAGRGCGAVVGPNGVQRVTGLRYDYASQGRIRT